MKPPSVAAPERRIGHQQRLLDRAEGISASFTTQRHGFNMAEARTNIAVYDRGSYSLITDQGIPVYHLGTTCTANEQALVIGAVRQFAKMSGLSEGVDFAFLIERCP